MPNQPVTNDKPINVVRQDSQIQDSVPLIRTYQIKQLPKDTTSPLRYLGILFIIEYEVDYLVHF